MERLTTAFLWLGRGGDLGTAWFALRGILGYLNLEIGLVSITGLSRCSISSGGVGSSGSALSKLVSEPTESLTLVLPDDCFRLNGGGLRFCFPESCVVFSGIVLVFFDCGSALKTVVCFVVYTPSALFGVELA